jgi:hypothetical protein
MHSLDGDISIEQTPALFEFSRPSAQMPAMWGYSGHLEETPNLTQYSRDLGYSVISHSMNFSPVPKYHDPGDLGSPILAGTRGHVIGSSPVGNQSHILEPVEGYSNASLVQPLEPLASRSREMKSTASARRIPKWVCKWEDCGKTLKSEFDLR